MSIVAPQPELPKLRRQMTPSQEAIQYDDRYCSLAESEGHNSIKPSYRGTPDLPHSPMSAHVIAEEQSYFRTSTPNEDDAHRLSVFTGRARAEDVNDAAGGTMGRRTPSPTRTSFNATDAKQPQTEAVAIPQAATRS